MIDTKIDRLKAVYRYTVGDVAELNSELDKLRAENDRLRAMLTGAGEEITRLREIEKRYDQLISGAFI